MRARQIPKTRSSDRPKIEAAAVIGTMLTIGRLAPDIAVTGYLGCVENGIGGNAYHPSDMFVSIAFCAS